MSTEILAPGSAEAASAPQAVPDGSIATVFLTGAFAPGLTANSSLFVQLQRADASWINTYLLQAPDDTTVEVLGPATYRVVRSAGGAAAQLGAEVNVTTAAGGSGGGSVTIADGSDAALGARADAAATTDTGTFSVIAFIKRGMQNWTTLLARIPALSTGAVPVENIKQPLVARQLAAGAANVNTALTTTTRRISMYANGGNVRYLIGSTSQTASSTSHFLAQGERVDVTVPATPNIGVIRGGASDCTLEVSELS